MRALTSLVLPLVLLAACGATETADGVTPADAPEVVTEEALTEAVEEWASFGEPMTSENTVSLAALLDSPEDFTGQTVRVEGTIADVCQMAGCWMVIADGERTLRVTMKDHAFSVDKGAATRTGQVEGVVIARPADPERAAHFASEAQNPDSMPENAGAEMLYEINASSVRIKNS